MGEPAEILPPDEYRGPTHTEKHGWGYGGYRPGAGRPRGATNVNRGAAVALQWLKDGKETPLEVMLEAMIEAKRAGNIDRAFTFAKEAAPYMHPRLAAIAVSNIPDNSAEIERKLTREQFAEQAKQIANEI